MSVYLCHEFKFLCVIIYSQTSRLFETEAFNKKISETLSFAEKPLKTETQAAAT